MTGEKVRWTLARGSPQGRGRRSQPFGSGIVVLGMMERDQSARYGAYRGMTARAVVCGRFVLAAITAAVVCAFGVAGVAGADASGAVTVRSSSLTSEFPEGIRVRLTASSDQDIESMAIRLRIGRHTRTGYDYLETVKRGGSMDGELLWRTNTATSYIPPGTVITYSFEFVDIEGQRYETETAEFVYHDPRFVWKEISSGPITVAYHGGSERRAREILDTMIYTLDRMAPLLGADREEPIRVTVYNSWNEMRRAIPPSSAVYGRHLITEGQAFNTVGTLLVLGSRSAAGTASHEMTHIIVHRAGEGVARKVPSWLHEGLAEYGNVDPGRSYDNALRQGVRQDRLLPITHMGSLPGKANDVLLFYGQSKALVRMMIDDFGAGKMREFMALYKGGKSMDDALTQTYGLDRVALENRWRASVGASPLSSAYSNDERPTPVPVPVLLPYTLEPNAGGQFVGDSRAVQAVLPRTHSGAAPAERVSSTPVPLFYGAASSDAGEGVRDTPVPLVYGAASSSGDEPALQEVEGSGCGASVGGALDLTAGAALLGLVALGAGIHRRGRGGRRVGGNVWHFGTFCGVGRGK